MSDLPLEEILARAMALDPDSRSAFLDEACGGDRGMRSELESLLAVAEQFPPPVDPPPGNDSQTAAPLPERIGRYPVLGVVGAGGMGLVYRARDPELEREVALKRLPIGIQADSAELARFRREARVLARLRHPNIATVHSLESGNEGPFLTMELVPGRTLHALLSEERVPVERALRIGVQIVAAMEAAHAEGIVHRDLKPLNIQVAEADEVKVLDFGLAKTVDEPKPDGFDATDATDETGELCQPTGPAAADAVTLTGLVMGTPGYISPEHLLGNPVGPPGDVWAFGCILFECLAGTSPYPATGSAARVPTRLRYTLGARDLEPDWSLLPNGLSADIDELLRSCLQTEPGDRPDSVAVRSALERAQEKMAAPSLKEWVISRRGVTALVCLLIVIAVAVMTSRPWRTTPVGIPASTVRQLTFRGNTVAFDLAPDGETAAYLDEMGRLVYLDVRTGQEQAAPLINAATNETISIVGARSTGLRWSPSGQELAVVGARIPADRTTSTFIVDRGEHRAIALGDADFSGVAWSPDGTRIAGTRGAGSTSAVCIVECEGGLSSDVLLDGTVRPAKILDWAAGDWLFLKSVENDSIYVVSASGGAPRSTRMNGLLRCLPDREKVCSYGGRQLRLASLDSDGLPADDYTVLADRLPRFATMFSLARDGRRVLYDNALLTEAWLGERATATSGDDDFRWSRLVRGSLSTQTARFSPDGSRVALVAARAGDRLRDLQILSMADGTRSIAVRDTGTSWPDWSPDGSELVYRNSRGMARVRLDGGSPSQIPGPQDPMYIRWLPDGRIVYMDREGDLWRAYSQLDVASGRITRLPIDPERGTLLQFAMAPGGNSIAVAGNRGERDEVKVWLIDLTNGSERLLYDGWAAPFDWSADAQWVYLITEHEPESSNRRKSRVLRAAVADGAIEFVADLPEPAFTWDRIDLSPDERRITCDQRRTGGDLWLMDIKPIRN